MGDSNNKELSFHFDTWKPLATDVVDEQPRQQPRNQLAECTFRWRYPLYTVFVAAVVGAAGWVYYEEVLRPGIELPPPAPPPAPPLLLAGGFAGFTSADGTACVLSFFQPFSCGGTDFAPP